MPYNIDSPVEREKLKRLFRVKKHELIMMQSRGFSLNKVYMMKSDRTFAEFDISIFTSLEYTFEIFLKHRAQLGMFKDRIEFSCAYQHPTTQELVLTLYLNAEPGKKVNKENFDIVKAFLQTQQFHHIILISELGIGPDSAGFVEHRIAGYYIEQFMDVEFALDPTKHALAPLTIKHIPSSATEAWSKEERLQPSQLPMELTTDAIAKRYGATSLDVFQMTIVGTTTNEQGYYRTVRKAPAEKKK